VSKSMFHLKMSFQNLGLATLTSRKFLKCAIAKTYFLFVTIVMSGKLNDINHDDGVWFRV
jgi:hypothetical protein